MGASGGEEIEVHAGDAHRLVQFLQFMARGSYVREAAGAPKRGRSGIARRELY
jgi:hypothetical protein